MKKMSLPLTIGLILACLVGCVLLTQVIPYGRAHQNPPVVQEPAWDSPQTRDIARRACFDCHSNETVWKWYSNVAPFSWLIQHDVDEGRSRLNFSEWGTTRVPHELVEAVQEGGMPPAIYMPMHPEARLSDAEKQQLIQGLQALQGQ
ncbi:MAG TPA: heme-binding domain-containing protein [Anaerolineaceae bacterium]